ncbi:lipopolysaccharide biosynthesis protein [Pseudothauera nasutitermitis]|uniref:Lipopolysaccharide biosynthesis protein n=1 Tax=Pseudothauera nasutitermitis TaxID=2565930 RepID=A0A4S4AXL3_9RHOO|nr:lipopolysaccharide biosynthesis protein [Pseudothauera nasutitermitis]THF64045.1 lipopolysaccharide biosynthesis protein [Pseudothauera nasutitermitis]
MSTTLAAGSSLIGICYKLTESKVVGTLRPYASRKGSGGAGCRSAHEFRTAGRNASFHSMQNNQPALPAYAEDEVDLRPWASTLRRHRGLFAVAGIILGMALGLGASLLSTRYVTEGLFLVPLIRSVGDYKPYEASLADGMRLRQFLHDSGQAGTPAGRVLHALAENPARYGRTLKLELAAAHEDREGSGIKADESSSAVLGIRIAFEHREATGGAPVVLLSEYVRESIIRASMEAILPARCSAFRAREQELRTARIRNELAIRQAESRIVGLLAAIAHDPEAGAAGYQKGTEHFLRPAVQLMAAEIQIADLQLAAARHTRDRLSGALKLEYYCQAQQALHRAPTGRAFLDQLKDIQAAVFQGQDMAVDIVEHTWNELGVEREGWRDAYLSGMRFVVPPEGVEVRRRRLAPVASVVAGGMLGGMFGIVLASGRVRRIREGGGRDEDMAAQQG